MRGLIGIIQIIISCYYFGTYREYESHGLFYFVYEKEWTTYETFNTYAEILQFVSSLIFIPMFFNGGYKIIIWNTGPLPMFNHTGGSSSYYTESNSKYSNIEGILRYRNSVLGNMSNEKAAKEYAKTAWIDTYANNGESNTTKTIGYINSRLGAMSNQTGYEYLKNGAKE